MTPKPKPPPWKDEEAVAAWIDDILLIQEYQELEEGILREEYGPDGIPASEVFASLERDAIASAKSGNMRPLADLIDPTNPFRSGGLRVRPEAEAMVAGYLRGQRAKRGRPKQRIEQREASTKVHGARREMIRIQKILEHYYPGEQKHRERAIAIAAARAEIERRELRNYLKKPRRHLP